MIVCRGNKLQNIGGKAAMTRIDKRNLRTRSESGLVFTACIWISLLTLASLAQTRQQPLAKSGAQATPDHASSQSVVVSADEDYRIGPRDVLEIKVDDADELSKFYE